MLTTRLADVAPPVPDGGGSGSTVLLVIAGLVLVAGVVALAIIRVKRGRGPGH